MYLNVCVRTQTVRPVGEPVDVFLRIPVYAVNFGIGFAAVVCGVNALVQV